MNCVGHHFGKIVLCWPSLLPLTSCLNVTYDLSDPHLQRAMMCRLSKPWLTSSRTPVQPVVGLKQHFMQRSIAIVLCLTETGSQRTSSLTLAWQS
eukprot:scaffold469508_cov17-Prasinocladus_malaysianus.AAC.1